MTDVPATTIPETVDMVHHMLCAYVGPPSDFRDARGGQVCPKCHRNLEPDAPDWEILAIGLSPVGETPG